MNRLQWIMSLGAVSYLGPLLENNLNSHNEYEMTDEILFGIHNKTKKKIKNAVEQMVEQYLNVSSRQEAYIRFGELKSGDLELARQVKSMLFSTIFTQKEKSDNKAVNVWHHLCNLYQYDLSDKHFEAYAYANAVVLLRIAGYKGWLSRDEVMNCLRQIGDEVENKFTSYSDFGLKAAVARKIHFGYKALSGPIVQAFYMDNIYSFAVYQAWHDLKWAGIENEM